MVENALQTLGSTVCVKYQDHVTSAVISSELKRSLMLMLAMEMKENTSFEYLTCSFY